MVVDMCVFARAAGLVVGAGADDVEAGAPLARG
jgi:hypothetical protein